MTIDSREVMQKQEDKEVIAIIQIRDYVRWEHVLS